MTLWMFSGLVKCWPLARLWSCDRAPSKIEPKTVGLTPDQSNSWHPSTMSVFLNASDRGGDLSAFAEEPAVHVGKALEPILRIPIPLGIGRVEPNEQVLESMP